MEDPRLGLKLEQQLPAYATAVQDPSQICNLHRISWKCWILKPLSKARDWTHILMDTSQIVNTLSHDGNFPSLSFSSFPMLNVKGKDLTIFILLFSLPSLTLPYLLAICIISCTLRIWDKSRCLSHWWKHFIKWVWYCIFFVFFFF